MTVSASLCFVAAFLVDFCTAEPTKASKSTQTAPESRMINWAKLDVVDYLRSGALIVAFFAVLLADRKGGNGRGGRKNMWVNGEVVAFFITGLGCFFFPTTFLESFTRTSLSYVHVFCMRALGSVLVMNSVLTARLQDSLENDGAVHANWLVTRLMMSGSLMLLMLQSNQDLDIFTEQHKTFVMLAVGLWFAGCVWQLFTCGQLGGPGALRNLRSPANLALIMVACEAFTRAIVIMAFPRAAEKMMFRGTMDGLTVHLLQQISIFRLFMGMSCVGALFCSDFYKKQLILCFALGITMMLPMLAYTQYTHQMFSRSGLIQLAIFVPLNLLVLYRGYSKTDDKKSR